MVKRLLDVTLSVILLLVMSPLFVVIASLIKLDSPGPVFFLQTRVGQGGRHFRILKFRTMRVDAAGPPLTVGSDPRITRSGAVLRALKLDELPQFFNVVVGQMSIVGPRPEVPEYVALYPPAVRAVVLSVRPGITDPASIEFRSESEILGRSHDPELTYVKEIMPTKLRLCAQYVAEMGLRRDIAIMFATVRAVFGHQRNR